MVLEFDNPIPGTTAGPQYAQEIHDALEVIRTDDHTDHPIPAAGLAIDDDVSFDGNNVDDVRAVRFDDQSADVDGSGDVACAYFKSGNFWINNGSGTAVQITIGTGINTTTGNTTFAPLAVSTNLVIPANATYVYLAVDTTNARTITLPTSVSVDAGRYFIIADVTGSAGTNNITVQKSGVDTLDGLGSYTILSNYGALLIIADGATGWKVQALYSDQSGDVKLFPSNAFAVGTNGTISLDAGAGMTINGEAGTINMSCEGQISIFTSGDNLSLTSGSAIETSSNSINMGTTSSISVSAGTTLSLSSTADDVNISANAGDINLTASATIIANATGALTATSGGAFTIVGATIVRKDGSTTMDTTDYDVVNAAIIRTIGSTVLQESIKDADGTCITYSLNSDSSTVISGGSNVTLFALGIGTKSATAASPSNGSPLNIVSQHGQNGDGSANANSNGGDLQVGGGAPGTGNSGAAGAKGYIDIQNATTLTTGPSAGAGDALPATPQGYLKVKIGGTLRRIPYYLDS